MRYFLKFEKILVFIMVITLVGVNVFAQQNIIAYVNGEPIYEFEIKTFLNKVIPIGKFHRKTLNKKKYWQDAITKAINYRALVIYFKKNDKNIYKLTEDKAKQIINTIKKRFNSESEFQSALEANGIDENILYQTYIDLNIKEILKNEYFKTKISEKELKDYYINNQNMFNLGKSFLIRNCLVKADARELSKQQMEEKKKEAKQLLLDLKSGKNKWNMCDTSIYPEKDRIYKFSKGYPTDVIFQSRPGDIIGPIKTIYGFLIIKIEKEIKPEIIPFDEIKQEIERLIKEKRFKKYFKEVLERAKNEANIKFTNINNS